MSQVKPTRRKRRLNLRALVILVIVLIVAPIGFFAVKTIQDRRGGSSLLAQAKEDVAKGKLSLAMGFLNRYLELNPDDLEALNLKGKLLAEDARTEPQMLDAVKALNQVLSLPANKKDSPSRREAQRRLARLTLELPKRARAAETLARELIKLDDKDAEAHRLLARALEQIGAGEKNTDYIEEARKEYEKAEALDPGDVEGAGRLATLYDQQMENPAKARQVLDKLVADTVKTPGTHAKALLTRAKYYYLLAHDNAKAEADLIEATKDAPGDLDVRLLAAEVAINRHDANSARDARHHLSLISEPLQDDLRIKVLKGTIDLAERQPDKAIRIWREGLMQTNGNDTMLTYQLAQLLLESNQVKEAEPLIAQFRRLVGSEEPPPAYRYLQGMYYLKSNQPTKAIAELEAIRYKSNKRMEGQVYFQLGLAYDVTRDKKKALEAFQHSAEISKDWNAPWLAIAQIQASDNPAEAVATLEKALALIPNDPALQSSLVKARWVQQMQKPPSERNWGNVEKALAAARVKSPGSVDLALVEADYFAANNRLDDAYALLKAAAAINPKSTEVWVALTNTQIRRGNIGPALDTIDQAIAAAGPQATFYVTRATLMVLKGRISDARNALSDNIGKVSVEQRPLMWKSLGDFYQVQKDYAAAHAAYDEWARLQPTNPEPRISLFDLAMANGNEEALTKALDDIKKVTGNRGYFWKLARIQYLLRDRPKQEAPDAAAEEARLKEAAELAMGVQKDDPQIPLGYILEGQVKERQKKTDEAIAAFRKAMTLPNGQSALGPLVGILVREGRDGDLDRLRESVKALPADFDRLAAVQALKSGHKDQAKRYAAMAAKGDPEGLDINLWKAKVLTNLGEPKEAEEALRILARQKPTEPGPWLELLMLQISQKKTAEAAQTVEQIRAQPIKVDIPELFWAQCYRAVGDFRKASDCYKEAIRRWPNEVTVLNSAVTFYEQLGRRDETEDALRQILRRNPTDGATKRKLALSLAGRIGNRPAWDEAVALIGAEPQPNDIADDQVIRASVFAQGSDPTQRRKAVEILKGLVNQNPGQNKIREQLARLQFSTNDLAGARENAAKAAAGDQGNADAILFYAGVLLAQKDVPAAEDQLNRLLVLDPEGLPVAELKARILAAKGKPEEGAKVLEKAFDNRFSSPEGLMIGEKMVSLLASPPLSQNEAAERVARKLAEISPRGRCVLAEFLGAHGKADEAVVELEKVAKADRRADAGNSALSLATKPGADPRWLKIADQYLVEQDKDAADTYDRLQKLALLKHFQGKYDEEIAAYKSLLAGKPSNLLFLNNMAWTLSEDMNRPKEALDWVDQAIKRAGAQPGVLDTRGVILTRLDRLDEAIHDLEAAAKDSRDGSLYFHLARAHLKKGNADEARKYRELAAATGLTREQLQPSERPEWDAVMAR